MLSVMDRLTSTTLIVLAGLGILSFFIVPRVPQPSWYHNFADTRALLGIPNFWNVFSNLPFVIVGLWGIRYVLSPKSRASVQSADRWMYLLFFAAVALTGVTSAYYHLSPDNPRLFWDRLTISIMFMALFAIIINEYWSRSLATRLFLPLLALGVAVVFYWYITESLGRGDLRPYLLAQLYPALAIVVIVWRSHGRYTGTATFYAALAWYAGAKLYEFLDEAIYSLGQVVSGHTLKHLGAAVSCYLILSWVRHRRPLDEAASKEN